MKDWRKTIRQKAKAFQEKHPYFCMVSPYVLFALVWSLVITKENVEKWWQTVPECVERALLFGLILLSWGGIGLLFGRFVSGWFPFLPTSRIYLPIPGRFLQRLLIGEETLYWGRTGPKGLPEEYYRVSPRNRNKMCLWGILFYTGWLANFILMALSSRLPDPLGDWIYPLFLAWPLLIHGLGNWDYSRGFHRLVEEQKQRDKEE
ncbi:hypothetical protein D1641_06480 [Colidextribacter sp. OB.20]|uniref:hypothetical protein n=1 Tax=Colidextribacter sp. OB.20 TaxID=2304568 RepID=UPI00136F4A05|nr:hypothetical protein [Colidextribacter sp. OB.20]NBI09662.1 hypothetical protein [Colidextribacter sp. OB.20]